jgi:hypothetical protein
MQGLQVAYNLACLTHMMLEPFRQHLCREPKEAAAFRASVRLSGTKGALGVLKHSSLLCMDFHCVGTIICPVLLPEYGVQGLEQVRDRGLPMQNGSDADILQ